MTSLAMLGLSHRSWDERSTRIIVVLDYDIQQRASGADRDRAAPFGRRLVLAND